MIDNDISYHSSDCSMYSISSFNDKFSPNNNSNFFVFHQNIRSFNHNIDEFILFINNLNVTPDAIILSETFFNDNNFHDIPGYNGYHRYRTGRGGGGISVYVLNSYVSDYILQLCCVNDLVEICAVSIKININIRIKIIGFYRPPSANALLFSEFLENNIISTFTPTENIFFGGDANIDLLSNNGIANQYMNMMYSGSFLPHITLPTRDNANGSTLIDHMWVRFGTCVLSGVFNSTITDHKLIFACVAIEKTQNPLFYKKFRDHSEINLQNLKNCLQEFIENMHVYDNLGIDIRCKIFVEGFFTIYNRCCPIRTKVFPLNKIKKPWLDRDLIVLCKRKFILYNLYKRGVVTYEIFVNFRNELSNTIRRCKLNYFREQFDKYKSDIRKTFQCINGLIGCKNSRNVSEIIQNDVVYSSASDIATLFSDYFYSVPTNLRNQIPSCTNDAYKSYLGPPRGEHMDFVCASEDEVKNVINLLLNKSSGLDTVPAFIYKFLNEILSPVICNLFNSSILEGTFPQILKIAEVIPIHKSGAKSNLNNHRPISLLTILSKIFEKLMCSRLKSHLYFNNIINDNQFGFRVNNSTSDAIVQFLDECYNSINSKNHILAVFLDLSKAFDTIDHNILKFKLYHTGIRGTLLDWFCSYLTSRKQRVTFNSAKSDYKTLSSGVPQGSVLAPTLFLIYINDMIKCSDNLKFVQFADDTTIYISGSNIDNLVSSLNIELNCVDQWLIANKLSLNILKSKYMLISNRQPAHDLNISIRNNNLLRVNEINFLGVIIDHKLIFKSHIENLSKKISQSIGAIYRISNFIPYRCIRTLYFALIQSRLSYGITAWGGASRVHMNKLLSLQNRINLLFVQRNTSPILPEINFLSVFKLYAYFCSIKFYSSYHLGLHSHFVSAINNLLPVHSYNTRHNDNDLINVPFYQKSRCHQSFLYRSCLIWNQFPSNIRNCETIEVFKKKCKTFLISNDLNF